MTDLLSPVKLDSVDRAIAETWAGRAVIVVDDDRPSSPGQLHFAAERATTELVSFAVRHTSGYLCTSLPDADADRLNLPAMRGAFIQTRTAPGFTVTVDAREGILTGISAADRASTIRLLAAGDTQASDLSRPGHVQPIRARRGGVLERFGHPEASVDLARLADLAPMGVLAELVSRVDPVRMATGHELREFADEFGLALISIGQLVAYRSRNEAVVRSVARASMPLRVGDFDVIGFTSPDDAREHAAFVIGDVAGVADTPVAIHYECLLGDVFGSLRCNCAEALNSSLVAIAKSGRGVLVYLRRHEGTSASGGLLTRLRAYAEQDHHSSECQSTDSAALLPDQPDVDIAVRILHDLGITSVSLLPNNSANASHIHRWGMRVAGLNAVRP